MFVSWVYVYVMRGVEGGETFIYRKRSKLAIRSRYREALLNGYQIHGRTTPSSNPPKHFGEAR
jgi:hypothetical protein